MQQAPDQPHIAVSCGDVNGVGLRCLAEALTTTQIPASIVLCIDASTLLSAQEAYQLPGTVQASRWECGLNVLQLESLHASCSVEPGIPTTPAALCAIRSLERAIGFATNNSANAILTLPINKHNLASAGWPFPGQTEMCATLASGSPLMVLSAGATRVALATVHIPVHNVEAVLSKHLVHQRIIQLHQHLRMDIAISRPRIAVLALDPHAGEGGVIGTADQTIVAPAVLQAQQDGIDALGPFPADGFFGFGAYQQYDGILAMYHDQGLIPLKLLARGAGVNCTAGLSIVRTSPDHGTAYDIVRKKDVDASSTLNALMLALTIARNRTTWIT